MEKPRKIVRYGVSKTRTEVLLGILDFCGDLLDPFGVLRLQLFQELLVDRNVVLVAHYLVIRAHLVLTDVLNSNVRWVSRVSEVCSVRYTVIPQEIASTSAF